MKKIILATNLLLAATGCASVTIIESPLTITIERATGWTDTLTHPHTYEIKGDSIREYGCPYCLPWRIDSTRNGKIYATFPGNAEWQDIIYTE